MEFRHKSWWNESVYEAFRKTGTIFCSCSGPRLPDELIKTADDIYVRFHGTKNWYRHDYSTEELTLWAKRVEECGATTVWAYFNNDRDGYSLKNAREFSRLLLRSKTSNISCLIIGLKNCLGYLHSREQERALRIIRAFRTARAAFEFRLSVPLR